MPRVSVLMAVYNGERFLREAAESVLAQTERDLELVLVDDASRDGSRALILELAAKDPRVKPVLLGENLGLAGALNQGLAVCTSEWVARLDADDIALPDRLARQLEFAKAHPDAAMIGSDVNFIDEHSRVIGRNLHLPQTHEQIDAALLWEMWPLVHPAILLRRSTLQSIGGYDASLRFCEDHDLFLRIAEAGRIYSIPERLTLYRIHGAQMTSRRTTNPIGGMIHAAILRRGCAIPPRPLRVRIFGLGISYLIDMQMPGDLLAPARLLRARWRSPGVWFRCATACFIYASWRAARLLGLAGGAGH